jgi:hypothetical protein
MAVVMASGLPAPCGDRVLAKLWHVVLEGMVPLPSAAVARSKFKKVAPDALR